MYELNCNASTALVLSKTLLVSKIKVQYSTKNKEWPEDAQQGKTGNLA